MALNTTAQTSAGCATGSSMKCPDGFAHQGSVMSHGTGSVKPTEMQGLKAVKPQIVKSKYVRTGKSNSTVKSPN
jgi:hypothetical protein